MRGREAVIKYFNLDYPLSTSKLAHVGRSPFVELSEHGEEK